MTATLNRAGAAGSGGDEGFDYIWQRGIHPPERKFPEFGQRVEHLENGMLLERDVAIRRERRLDA